jgi:hypothetical protein
MNPLAHGVHTGNARKPALLSNSVLVLWIVTSPHRILKQFENLERTTVRLQILVSFLFSSLQIYFL